MPIYNGALSTITAPSTCVGKSGSRIGYLMRYNDIATVTESAGTITAFTLSAQADIYKIEFESGPVESFAEYTEDTGVYEVVVNNMRFLGNDASTTLAITQLTNACDLCMIVVGSNGVRYLYGLEMIGTTKTKSARGGKIVRHRMDFGTKGGGEDGSSRNEFDYRAEHDYAPLSVVGTIDLEALVG